VRPSQLYRLILDAIAGLDLSAVKKIHEITTIRPDATHFDKTYVLAIMENPVMARL
jgi:hypothetical protein